MFKKIIFWVVILLIVVVAGVYFVRNMLVAKAVETGSTCALGVDTNLGSAALEIRGGSLELSNLEVGNPEGFKADNFMVLRRGVLDVEAGSILDDEVVVDSFIIEGVTLNLEQIDRSGNYQVLLDNIKKMDLSSSGDSQKFRIGLIALRDIKVNGSLNLMGKSWDKSFTISNFQLRNVGGETGAKIGEIAATIVKNLISKALSEGNGVLPDGFGKNLSGLKDQGVEKIKTEAEDALKGLGESLTGDKK